MMEGIKGGGRVGVGEAEDMGDGMQCSDHPYRNNSNPGGICAFCLQEKLGKLVSSSSSFPLPVPGSSSSSSSSSSPSFRSDTGVAAASCGGNGGVVGISSSTSSSFSMSVRPVSTKSGNDIYNGNNSHYQECYTRRARIPFLLAKKKIMVASSDHHHQAAAAAADDNIVFKRSKSTVTPRRGRFLDGSVDDGVGEDFSPRIKRGGFWSFLFLSSKTQSAKKLDKVASMAAPTATSAAAAATGSAVKPKEKSLGSSMSRKGSIVVMEDDGDNDDVPNNQATPSTASSSFERKVSRSRSVGCGSRSFSGDFFERISTGFGDCTLRRVESQREGKPKLAAARSSSSSSAMKERVKCGGIFGGFIITSSSSFSYWLTSSADQDHHHVNGKPTSSAGPLVHGRTKSWGWAFASPMRAFTKPSSSSSGKKDTTIRESNNNNSNTAPNLSAIPSLLAVRG